VDNESKPDVDDRPPICPACGVTMGIILADDGATRYACLELLGASVRRGVVTPVVLPLGSV
jgi:ribosomal protein S27AE